MKPITCVQNILLTRLLRYRVASTFSPARFGSRKFLNQLVNVIFEKV